LHVTAPKRSAPGSTASVPVASIPISERQQMALIREMMNRESDSDHASGTSLYNAFPSAFIALQTL